MNNKLVDINDITTIDKSSLKDLIEKLDLLNSHVLTKTESLIRDFDMSNTDVSVFKSDLDSKLQSLDTYLNKVSSLQKETLGDKSLDKKFGTILLKIDELYNSKIEEMDAKIKEKEADILNLVNSAKNDYNANIGAVNKSLVDTFNSKINSLKDLSLNQNVINFSLRSLEYTEKADKLQKSVEEAKEVLKEYANLKKTGIAYSLGGAVVGGLIALAYFWLTNPTLF